MTPIPLVSNEDIGVQAGFVNGIIAIEAAKRYKTPRLYGKIVGFLVWFVYGYGEWLSRGYGKR